ncbi:hypothetical protein DMUE_1554 [Dictyocoela muelleri]|nr:hypothetical protein DMUE_1554 [Dictyocoela muelleri]
MKISSMKYNKKISEMRKNISYNVNDMVFVRNFNTDKVTSRWNGPYKDVRISGRGNNLYLDKGNKIMRVSINKYRAIYERGRCNVHDKCTYILIKTSDLLLFPIFEI